MNNQPQLSIIIVSYNALAYIDLCLNSVFTGIKNISAEVILVDNNSEQAVVDHAKKYFPELVIIDSKENLGFGKGNNLGLKKAKGKYVLYLNPDTIVHESALKSALEKMDHDEQIGSIGLRMINGRGDFLTESKRSIPSLLNAFGKFTGLAKAFPNSQIWAAYNLHFIDQKAEANVGALPGACMFVRNDNQQLIAFDPDYFMYGEDIDLSYRILKSGKKLLYLGSETIVHFKGESTNKHKWSYHYHFYQTMWLFHKKHFGQGLGFLSSILLIPVLSIMAIFSFLMTQFNATQTGTTLHNSDEIQKEDEAIKLILDGGETRDLKSNDDFFDLISHIEAKKAPLKLVNLRLGVKMVF